MQDDNQPQKQDEMANKPLSGSGSKKVIQPTPGLAEELNAQTSPATPNVTMYSNQDTVSPAPTYHQSSVPSGDQMQVGVSASQMGLNHVANKSNLDIKNLVIKLVIGLVIIGSVIAILVFTNIIALSQFKTISYTNSKGTNYSLSFYTKHTTKTLKTGNTSLVSKVSEGGKYPITLSIANGTSSGYARAKNCSGSGMSKQFDVRNNNLNQTISVCGFSSGTNTPNGVYIAGILYNEKTSIVTISQDLSGVDLSSKSGAQQSLPKFGLDPYQDDIRKIIASIKID